MSLGLMSYSAYLWHQPVLAFYRSHASVDIELPVALGLLLFSLLLSYLTWRFVEQPFRHPNNRWLLPGLTITACAMFTVTVMITVNQGKVLSRPDYSTDVAKERLKINHGLDYICKDSFTLSELCRTS